MPERINIDDQLNEPRAPIDAKWSPGTRRAVIVGAVVVTVGAIAGGLWAATAFSTPGMPDTAKEALAVLGTSKFERMSPDRRSAYAEEAGRLLRDLPVEDRRDMFRDEERREAMRALMEQRMADIARMIARGEMPDFSSMMPPRRERSDNDERRQRRAEMSDEERADQRDQFRERIRERINEMYQSGNPQTSELMGEMFRGGMRGMRGGRGR